MVGADHDLTRFPDALGGKRILLCTESFGPVNGVSKTTMMLVDHLRSHGVSVAVVAPKNHTTKNTFLPTRRHDETRGQHEMEVRLQGYPLPLNQELSIVYPLHVAKLYRRTFGGPPDLVYLASPASVGFQVMLQVRQQPEESQVPIICNFQTDLGGYCSILFPPPFSKLAVFALESVESFLFRHPSIKTIFYPSRFVRRYLERMGVKADKLDILQRGVNTHLFHPRKRSDALRAELSPNGEVVFICVARLAGEKGFGFLARVAKALAARNLPFRLYIVGGNPNPDVVDSIEALFAPLTARGTVVFAGQKTGEDLAAAFASGDVFLHCSVTETFGLVVLESMASGVPVLARDEGGPSDIVRDGETGYLVPPHDLDAFVERAVRLAHDVALRHQMGEAARRQAEDATWEKINNKVAWRMLETIEAHEREQKQERTSDSLWVFLNEGVRARTVDARIAGGLAVIFASWSVVGLYLLLIKLGLWVKGRVRA